LNARNEFELEDGERKSEKSGQARMI